MSTPVLPLADCCVPLVSVVVIGRNEGERLRRCLDSVARLAREGFDLETIYVDSGSDDDSVMIGEAAGASVITLRPAHPTAALGRNAGWRAAHGSFILFLDGDTVLHERFVADSLPEFVTGSTGVVWGHRRELCPEASIYNRTLDLDWIYPAGKTLFCGGDALFRRSILLETGGFDETLIAGEEPELCRRIAALGFTILHVDRPMTLHDLAMTRWSQYWRRGTRTGHAYAEVSAKLQNTDFPLWVHEARKNRIRVVSLACMLLTVIVASLFLHTLWPAFLLMLLLMMLALQTAWRARWRSTSIVTLLLYGVHSHLQQVPIFFGQMKFLLNRKNSVSAALLEYK